MNNKMHEFWLTRRYYHSWKREQVYIFLTLVIVLASALSMPVYSVPHAFSQTLVNGARKQLGVTFQYDPAYVDIVYPGGDVPIDRGVCSDVVVRAFRAVGIDLQRLVHEDMRAHFANYPQLWGLRKTDSNIDHRRVPNLERFFERRGKAVSISSRNSDYLPGDIVSWRLPNGLAHIGVVSDSRVGGDSGRPLIIHNIGHGVRQEDVLFSWRQVGHYRWSTGSTSNGGGTP